MPHHPTGTIVRLIVHQHRRLLLVQGRRQYERNEFELPGGQVKRRETYFSAARRELREETGLILVRATELARYDRRTPFGTFWRFVIFKTTHAYGELMIRDPDEIISAKWYKRADLPYLDEHTRYFCQKYGQNNLWPR